MATQAPVRHVHDFKPVAEKVAPDASRLYIDNQPYQLPRDLVATISHAVTALIFVSPGEATATLELNVRFLSQSSAVVFDWHIEVPVTVRAKTKAFFPHLPWQKMPARAKSLVLGRTEQSIHWHIERVHGIRRCLETMMHPRKGRNVRSNRLLRVLPKTIVIHTGPWRVTA